MFDPDANKPRPRHSLIYFGACIIAGLRLARASQVNTRVSPTSIAVEESIELSQEIYNRVFRKDRVQPAAVPPWRSDRG